MTHSQPGSARGVTVFHGGTAWLDAGKTTHAVAVRDGIIAALGDDALSYLDEANEVVDLGGKLLLPALSDGHCHPVFAGLEYQGPAVTGKRSVEAVVQAVAEFAAEHPDMEWIRGGSYDPTLAPDGRFDAAWLDAVVPDRPVILRASDYHTLWCNNEALRRAGVTADTPQPRLGFIEHREDGSPLGTLREWHACDLIFDAAPDFEPESLVQAVEKACEVANSNGVTWMQDAWVEPEGHLPYLQALELGVLTVRTNLAFRADPDLWRDRSARFVEMRREVEAAGQPEMLSARTIKFFVDGVVENATAEMLEPYEHTHSHGLPNWTREGLIEAVLHFDALGFQTHLHAIGDRAIRHALDAVEAAREQNPLWDRRSTITHVQVVNPADRARFKQLDVVANFQANWAQEDPLMTALTAPKLGPERTAQQYPIRSLLDDATHISFGTDWPVSPNDLVETLLVAVTRQTLDGKPAGGWVPEQRIDLQSSLRIATQGTNYQAYAEEYRGKIAEGYVADLAILETNLLEVEPQSARGTKVVATYLNGARVFAR